jgi:hypothetical protein
VFEGHFRHPSAGCFDQQGGATRTDVPVANYFRNVELRRDILPEIGANLLICPPDKRHIRFPASLPTLVFTTGSIIGCQDRPLRERRHRRYQFGETGIEFGP